MPEIEFTVKIGDVEVTRTQFVSDEFYEYWQRETDYVSLLEEDYDSMAEEKEFYEIQSLQKDLLLYDEEGNPSLNANNLN